MFVEAVPTAEQFELLMQPGLLRESIASQCGIEDGISEDQWLLNFVAHHEKSGGGIKLMLERRIDTMRVCMATEKNIHCKANALQVFKDLCNKEHIFHGTLTYAEVLRPMFLGFAIVFSIAFASELVDCGTFRDVLGNRCRSEVFPRLVGLLAASFVCLMLEIAVFYAEAQN